MPTNRRTRKYRRRTSGECLTPDVEAELLHGRPWLSGEGVDDLDILRHAWETHRAEVLAKWASEHPAGTRPFGFWLFEAVPQYGERPTTPRWNEFCEPYRERWLKHGILHTNTFPPSQEPEVDFLRRHGLLTPGEIRRLDAAARKAARKEASDKQQ